MRVPSQVSLIDYLVFKQRKNHHMVMTSLVKHTSPPPSQNMQSLLPPPPPNYALYLWMAPKAEIQKPRPNWNDFMDQLTSEKTNSPIYVSLN